MINFSHYIEANIVHLGIEFNNNLYMLREDLIPYSFGGNKARKGILFFEDIDNGDYDCVVTYGGSHSNHCRVISNMAWSRNMDCYIIGPDTVNDMTFNSKLVSFFGARVKNVPVECVKESIDELLQQLIQDGKKPYFIPGGGHSIIGTQAYEECYELIKRYEREHNVFFDYVFFASGTGTTHAGLVCGQIKNKDIRKIVGISIARKNPRGREIVMDSIKEFMPTIDQKKIEDNTIFIDQYIGDGYGSDNKEIISMIKHMMRKYGVPMDTTYTGKAMYGMWEYLKENYVLGKNILFIHTGGTPLFFNDLDKW